MKKYRLSLILLSVGVILCLLTFNGLMQIEKLNFLIEPYFILFSLGLFSIFMSILIFILTLLAKAIHFFFK